MHLSFENNQNLLTVRNGQNYVEDNNDDDGEEEEEDGENDDGDDDRHENKQNNYHEPFVRGLNSMEINLKTTVPQNLQPKKLASRHKPTRQSLRHSRMLVTKRAIASETTRTSQLPNCETDRNTFTNLLVLNCLQILFAISLASMSYWLFETMPISIDHQWPFFNFVTLLPAAIFGLLFIPLCKSNRSICLRSLFKFASLLLSMISIVLCLTAIAYQLTQLLLVLDNLCVANKLAEFRTQFPITDCKCTDSNSNSCLKLHILLTVILTLMILFNSICCLICALIFYCYQKLNRKYANFSQISTIQC